MYSISEQLQTNMNNLFNAYFKSLTFYKIKDKDMHSLYYSRIRTQTMSGYNYVIVTIKLDNNVPGTKKSLNQLDWDIIQTRELKEEYLIEKCELVIPKKIKDVVSHINLVKNPKNPSDTKMTKYMVENNQYPFAAAIIHKKDSEHYPPILPLDMAIHSFKLLIMKLND